MVISEQEDEGTGESSLTIEERQLSWGTVKQRSRKRKVAHPETESGSMPAAEVENEAEEAMRIAYRCVCACVCHV